MEADWYRIANFIMQAVYLPFHLFFIIMLIKHKQPTPIWKWFISVVAGLWGLILGRFIETCLFLFWVNNTAYYFAVDVTLISTTVATMSFLFWNLYITKHESVAKNKHFRAAVFAVSGAVCVLVATNPHHHLFYSELDLLGAKTHGVAFVPCTLIVYGMLFVGLIISIIYIIRYENNKVLRIIVFSMYPILPGVTNLIRSISGTDTLDFNAIVMSLSILCLYDIVFRRSYVGVVAESIESVINQTLTPIAVYDPVDYSLSYVNEAAMDQKQRISALLPLLGAEEKTIEENCDGRVIRATSTVNGDKNEVIATFTDVTDIVRRRKELEEQLTKQNELLTELDDQKRNIEAYLEALYSIPNLKEKQEMTERVQTMIAEAFTRMKVNLETASLGNDDARAALEENLKIAQETITTIRRAVARLKEGA